MICSIDGCEKPSAARGWCKTHYYRWNRNGDPLMVRKATPNPYERTAETRAKMSASKIVHGMSRTPTHNSWSAMTQRCTDKNCKDYLKYGARGIVVCERWSVFTNFLEDMGIRPEGTTLDRIDNLLGYYKENCRWATAYEQTHNRGKINNSSRIGKSLKRSGGI